LQGLPDNKAERKIGEIRKGGELARALPVFPEQRAYKDFLWAVIFAVLAVVVLGTSIYFSSTLSKDGVKLELPGFPGVATIAAAVFAGAVVSLIAAYIYIALASRAAACVVWTSLLFGPTLSILLGLAVIVLGNGAIATLLIGGVLIVMGLLSLSCVLLCWRALVPFMIMLVKVIATIIEGRPMVLAVSVIGSLAGIAWVIVASLAFAGLSVTANFDLQNKYVRYSTYFVYILALVWGLMVAYNVCHVTYCGVFGRWYHRKDTGASLQKSLGVALTTSFGSICLGSFLVAFIRALEAVVRSARQDAQQEGNVVCCILLLAIECFITCIGDILEYFSEWAYVQCAIRGASFFEAARITYSFFTCANLQYILSDLLLDSVVNMGTFVCAVLGAGAGALVAVLMNTSSPAIAWGAVVGFLSGMVAGGSAVGIISSGTKTILACWAEDPEPLRQTHSEIHAEFESRILSKL
jgi:hypothetical protein